jgi:hypothetical protein
MKQIQMLENRDKKFIEVLTLRSKQIAVLEEGVKRYGDPPPSP